MEPYVSAKSRADFARICAERLARDGREPHPAAAHGKKIARSFWGYAWCRHIETWQDYENRLPMGRSLLRAGAVVSLDAEDNLIRAYVADRELYEVRIPVDAPDPERLDGLRARCAGNIGSLMAFIRGEMSEEILSLLTDPANGLFPERRELRFICGCLDDSCLCRHAAAALYGLGARLDDEPELFFRMRGVPPESFFSAAPLAEELSASAGEIDPEDLSGTFGIDLETF